MQKRKSASIARQIADDRRGASLKIAAIPESPNGPIVSFFVFEQLNRSNGERCEPYIGGAYVQVGITAARPEWEAKRIAYEIAAAPARLRRYAGLPSIRQHDWNRIIRASRRRKLPADAPQPEGPTMLRKDTPLATAGESRRAETGLMKFELDWRGVFIRGDHASMLAAQLLTQCVEPDARLGPGSLEHLLAMLIACNEGTKADDVQLMREWPECVAHPR